MAKISEKTQQKVLKIMELAMKVNNNTLHDVFVNYSGHVEELDVTYHKNGYCGNSENLFKIFCEYIDGHIEYEAGNLQRKLNSCIAKLQRLLKKY